ncbi:Transferrin receptor-like, ESAG6-like [Trypanosoma congolense IL3000]|uniref:Transferrin receptor-like, ESAG6-like n=1 Tax=Trypanosoma congolense (strain IL3000) TaxID=1068625 RepID=F9WGZ7_TRYCI|nr:Transferrin receptor-like, ESAG6-like [Trypanosoma congolense IL3000]
MERRYIYIYLLLSFSTFQYKTFRSSKEIKKRLLVVMVMELRSKWLWLVGVFMTWSPVLGTGTTPKAIPTKAGAAICTLSKTLKDVTPWATQQVEKGAAKIGHLEMKLLEWQSKFIQYKSKGSGSEECKITGLLFRQVRKELDKARKEVEKLEREASKAAAFAANSAGRLEEFITVFANARNESGTGFCLGKEKAATPEELNDCFGGKVFSEDSLVDIGERVSEQEPNLDRTIEGIKHSVLSSHFNGVSSTAGCNLIKGEKGGILKSKSLEKSLWWGGGILSIGATYGGTGTFVPGEIVNATGNKATWTADPAQQIVHLKNASDTFKAFKAVQEAIQDKVKSIEDKIQSCLGGSESDENNTEQNVTGPDIPIPTSPTCFDNVAKIAAELKEKRALLARYQKVKGWIPPSSASHPTTQFLGLLLTLL